MSSFGAAGSLSSRSATSCLLLADLVDDEKRAGEAAPVTSRAQLGRRAAGVQQPAARWWLGCSTARSSLPASTGALSGPRRVQGPARLGSHESQYRGDGQGKEKYNPCREVRPVAVADLGTSRSTRGPRHGPSPVPDLLHAVPRLRATGAKASRTSPTTTGSGALAETIEQSILGAAATPHRRLPHARAQDILAPSRSTRW